MAASGEAVLHPRVAARVVLELHGARRTEPNVFHDLSDRELQVLKLIAEGLHNSEIASRLYVSEKTVKSHVSNILSKLHLADRTPAAVYAWREGGSTGATDSAPKPVHLVMVEAFSDLRLFFHPRNSEKLQVLGRWVLLHAGTTPHEGLR